MMKIEKNILNTNLPPLSQRMRPQVLSDYMGQSNIVDKDSLIISAIKKNNPFSIILWGPPGTGKTTLAKILAKKFSVSFYELSAVSSGVSEIRKILKNGSENFKLGKRSILFIDEIHRFNKSQQDTLLHSVENGSIILIGATTENPSFEVIPPLLSRCKILKLNPLNENELKQILNRAIHEDIVISQRDIQINEKAETLLFSFASGDARKMLNTFELAVMSSNKNLIMENDILRACQQKNIVYDKNGDYHFDVISAFIKSIRGSDPDAAIYWLAIMLEGGEKPEYIARRLIILASEDIGNAEPYALQLATSGFEAVKIIGMPEARIILAQICTYLAAIPKSNASYKAIDSAISYIRKNGAESIPLHLRNAPTRLSRDLGHGKDYKYIHNYQNHFMEQNYFPDSIKNISFYKPSDEGREKFLKTRLSKLWKNRF